MKKPTTSILIILALIVIAACAYFGYNQFSVIKPTPVDQLNADTATNVTEKTMTIDSITFTYTGKVNADGKPHGVGKATYTESIWKNYSGNWTDGKWDGDGTLTFEIGDTFTGTFRNGEFLSGTYTTITFDSIPGDYFTGIFKDGIPYNGSWFHNDHEAFQDVVNGSSVQSN